MRHTLGILIIGAAGLSAPSVSVLAQQGQVMGACSNVRVANAIFMRCESRNTRDFLLPKSGTTTDPAALEKLYGSWGGSFGGHSWSSTSGR
jgi:hypothetical protein